MDMSAGSVQADVPAATPPPPETGRQAAQPADGIAARFAVTESSLPALLRKVADQQPNRAAYRFIDYEVNLSGSAEVLTWSQVHRRAMTVADELRLCASTGDRVAIVAPQSLHYIVAFLGVLQAGLIAVPLPAPQFGIHDKRITSALRDCSPAIILTTLSVIDEVSKYAPRARAMPYRPASVVVAVDSLDQDSPRDFDATRYAHSDTAYLQYTSGSTGEPAGVVVSHRNVIANCEHATGSDDFGVLAALLPRHGFVAGHYPAAGQPRHRSVDESVVFSATARALDAIAGQTYRTSFQCPELRFRISGSRNVG